MKSKTLVHDSELFANLIRKYAKRQKVRQIHLANMINVTPSAMSQMCDCNIKMSLTQLNTIAKALKLDQGELYQLQALLSKIRNGNSTIRSPFNRLIKQLRRDNHLSIANLSIQSGISRAILKAYEENYDILIKQNDIEILAKIYNCDAEYLLKNATLYNDDNSTQEYENYQTQLKDEAAEISSRYDSSIKTPIVKIEELALYTNNIPLVDFANAKSIDFCDNFISEDCIAINLNDKLKSIIPNAATIIIKDYNQDDEKATTFLALDRQGEFSILTKDENSDLQKLLTTSHLDNDRQKFIWILPIVQIFMNLYDI